MPFILDITQFRPSIASEHSIAINSTVPVSVYRMWYDIEMAGILNTFDVLNGCCMCK